MAHPMSVGDRSDTDVAEYTTDSSSGALAHELPVVEKALPATISSHLAEVSTHLKLSETTIVFAHVCVYITLLPDRSHSRFVCTRMLTVRFRYCGNMLSLREK
jgi:hypothetical protein